MDQSVYHPVSLSSTKCEVFQRPSSLFLVFHGKFHLTNLVFYPVRISNLLAFEETATRVMDEGHTVDVVYLNFDTIN